MAVIKQRFLHIVLFTCIGFPSFSQSKNDVLFFSEIKNVVNADAHTTIFVRNNGTNKLVDDKPFVPKPNTEYEIDFNVKNDLTDDTIFYLQCQGNSATNFELEDTEGKLLYIDTTGFFIPLEKRFGKDDKDFLPINLHKNQVAHIRLQVKNTLGEPPNTNINLYSPLGYLSFYKSNQPEQNTRDFLLVLFTGGMFLMLLFFWFMYLKTRQALYGSYSVYLTLQWLYGVEKLGPSSIIGQVVLHFPKLAFTLIEPLVMAAVAAYMQFVIVLLGLKEQNKSLYKLLKYLSYGLWVYAILHGIIFCQWPNLPIRNFLFSNVRLVLTLLTIYILVVVAIKVKSSVKKYYIIGNIFFLAFGIFSGMVVQGQIVLHGYLERLTVTNWYSLGILIECVVFAFALGIRMKELQSEKEEAQKKLIDQMQLNEQLIRNDNQLLEEKVAQRTQQVLEQEKELENAKMQETKTAYEKQLSETKMLALRSRMNPHFLFNSLNSIKYFILKNDTDTAAFYLNKFSKLLRQILDYTGLETISLQQELEALKLYLDIESLRFGDSFHYQIIVDENVVPEQIRIPPLLLQPYVENAIWHGLANSNNSDKQCTISVTKASASIRISIHDNGIGRIASASINENKHTKQNSYGMKISEEMIEIYNHLGTQKLSLEINDIADENLKALGTTVNISVLEN